MVNALVALGANPSKVHYNPYGINCKLFHRVNVLASDIRFLAVARFAEKKAPLNTIKAFSEVVRIYPTARLIMAGIGPLFEKAKELVTELRIADNVDFKGVLNPQQIVDEMKNTRAFVQHSVTASDGDSEGTPNSILEASATGLPIISTRHAGIKEAVIHEKTGYLVEEHDVQTMATYMIKLAGSKELAAQLGSNGAQHIREHYELQQRIDKLAMIVYADIK
jgi:glycosyltransferase involved in cell wall biosynthesis